MRTEQLIFHSGSHTGIRPSYARPITDTEGGTFALTLGAACRPAGRTAVMTALTLALALSLSTYASSTTLGSMPFDVSDVSDNKVEWQAAPNVGASHGRSLPLPLASPRSAPWWERDVWLDPDRPFLYYGDPKDVRPEHHPEPVPPAPLKVKPKTDTHQPEAPAIDPDDFSSFKTVEALKAERERRLNVAIMEPSPANMAAYQAINAHMLGLSARFAAAWQLGRMMNPEYDFTSTHPSANFATAALAEVKRETSRDLLKSLASDAGLLFIGLPGDPLTEIAAGPVQAFARTHRLPLMAVALKPGFSGTVTGAAVPGFAPFDRVHADTGQAAKLGLTTFPAVLLIPNPDAMARRADFAILKGALAGRDGMLIAAGAVSAEELLRRITFLLQKGGLLAKLASSTPSSGVNGTSFPGSHDMSSGVVQARVSPGTPPELTPAASHEWTPHASGR